MLKHNMFWNVRLSRGVCMNTHTYYSRTLLHVYALHTQWLTNTYLTSVYSTVTSTRWHKFVIYILQMRTTKPKRKLSVCLASSSEPNIAHDRPTDHPINHIYTKYQTTIVWVTRICRRLLLAYSIYIPNFYTYMHGSIEYVVCSYHRAYQIPFNVW